MSSSFCVQVVFLLMHNFNGIQGNLAGFWFAALIAAFWYTTTHLLPTLQQALSWFLCLVSFAQGIAAVDVRCPRQWTTGTLPFPLPPIPSFGG